MSDNCTFSIRLPDAEMDTLDQLAALGKTRRSTLCQEYIHTGLIRALDPEDITRRCDQLKAELLEAAQTLNAS